VCRAGGNLYGHDRDWDDLLSLDRVPTSAGAKAALAFAGPGQEISIGIEVQPNTEPASLILLHNGEPIPLKPLVRKHCPSLFQQATCCSKLMPLFDVTELRHHRPLLQPLPVCPLLLCWAWKGGSSY